MAIIGCLYRQYANFVIVYPIDIQRTYPIHIISPLLLVDVGLTYPAFLGQKNSQLQTTPGTFRPFLIHFWACPTLGPTCGNSCKVAIVEPNAVAVFLFIAQVCEHRWEALPGSGWINGLKLSTMGFLGVLTPQVFLKWSLQFWEWIMEHHGAVLTLGLQEKNTSNNK